VRSATGVQREIAAKGKTEKSGAMYHADGTWSDGLVSAAKLVVEATHDLCEAANQAAKNNLDVEFVVVSARNVSSATIKLITAASVRADKFSQSHTRLQAAGKSVIDATAQLVAAADSTRNPKEDEEIVLPKSEAKIKAAEMDAQVNILRMEKELERARHGLAGMRKAKYTQPGNNFLDSSYPSTNSLMGASKGNLNSSSRIYGTSRKDLGSTNILKQSEDTSRDELGSPTSASTIVTPQKWTPRVPLKQAVEPSTPSSPIEVFKADKKKAASNRLSRLIG
jgi:I/LWEQ domain